MLHAYCVEDLIVDGESVGDLAEVRRLLYQLMRPAIAPARVYAHRWRAGDLAIFHNHGLRHSVVGSLEPTDLRLYHQCNLASSEPPLGPSAEPPVTRQRRPSRRSALQKLGGGRLPRRR
jgi:hypothetical protein